MLSISSKTALIFWSEMPRWTKGSSPDTLNLGIEKRMEWEAFLFIYKACERPKLQVILFQIWYRSEIYGKNEGTETSFLNRWEEMIGNLEFKSGGTDTGYKKYMQRIQLSWGNCLSGILSRILGFLLLRNSSGMLTEPKRFRPDSLNAHHPCLLISTHTFCLSECN